MQQSFINAWQRSGFNSEVGNPSGGVTKYGSTGLIQQFPGMFPTGTTLALIKPDTTSSDNVAQVQAAMFAYYGTVSVATAGYPTSDTLTCPAARSPTTPTCQWQVFSLNYALFVYSQGIGGSQNYAIRDPYFSKWMTFGGVGGIGPPTSAETTVTSRFSSAATVQTFQRGAIYNITSGVLTGRVLAIAEPVYDFYEANGADGGSLGLPVTEALALPNGTYQQTFEGGAIEYDPVTGIAMLQPPIGSVLLSPSGSVQMNVGDTLAAQVTLLSTSGAPLTDRTVAWNTSNARVVKIQANGFSATLQAVGAGTASITVVTEGKISPPLTVTVVAVCCQIGEGAPTAAIQQAFQNAVVRNALSVQLPAASGVARAGNGYVQTLMSTGTTPVPYLVAVADSATAGYVVSGILLSQYLALGGPAGGLGYPLSDATAGGRQTFQQGTLAGNPVQLVSGTILTKWGTLGYETGAAGSPAATVTAFLTFRGTAGNMQAFQNGLILDPTIGPLSSQAFFVTGAVLTAYTASGGPGGDLGAPTDEQHSVSGLIQQDFEGGSINYLAGASSATVVKNPRQPLVTATPGTVVSGSAVHLVVGGFDNGATVRVSESGLPDFVVTLATGAYAWDAWVPSAAPSGVVNITATAVSGTASAKGSYTVHNVSSAPLTISIVSGDQQSGAPGAQLAQPLVVVVKDQNGNPLPGQPVTFAASPGAQIVPASAVTGASGQAGAMLSLPAAAGVALATAQAGSQVVTFGAKSAAFSLANFPALTQAVDGLLGKGNSTIRQKGALLTAVASILRYYQLVNKLPQPSGLADPATLNQFLKSFCIVDSQGNQVCDGFISLGANNEQIVNLWRLGAFVAGGVDVSIEQASLNSVRALVGSGSPVLVALSLGGLGSHFVVATGIASDGSVVIADPNPAYAQTNLYSYLNGFSVAAGAIQGTLSGVVRLLPQTPGSPGFLVAATAPVSISSAAGVCGQTLQFPDTAAVAGAQPVAPPGTLYFTRCDGSNGPYQLDVAAQGPYNGIFTDLSANGGHSVLTGSVASSSAIVHNGTQWTVAPLAVGFDATGVGNAANFTSGLAPGALISIHGSGFASTGTTVQVNDQPAAVIAALPFQVNAQIPLSIPPGPATLTVSSAAGSAQQPISISAVAPAIFSISPTQAAITNQDNSLNTPSNPAGRGSTIVIYGTGLGAVAPVGTLSAASESVSVVIGGSEIASAFAGLTPGVTGLYQVNVTLPSSLPPGLSLPLYLKQAGVVSNAVTVAVQ